MGRFGFEQLRGALLVGLCSAVLLGANWRVPAARFETLGGFLGNVLAAAGVLALSWHLGARRNWRLAAFTLAFTAAGGVVTLAREPSPVLYLTAALLLGAEFLRLTGTTLVTAAVIAGAAGLLGFRSLFPAIPFIALGLAELFQPGSWRKRQFRRLLIDVLRVVTLLVILLLGLVLYRDRLAYPQTPLTLPGSLLGCMAVLTLGRFRTMRLPDQQLLVVAALAGTLLVGEILVFETHYELSRNEKRATAEIGSVGRGGDPEISGRKNWNSTSTEPDDGASPSPEHRDPNNATF